MDKQLMKYKQAKQTMFIVGPLTFIQGIAIIFQAIYLAKGITMMFHGTAWTAVLPYLLYFLVFFILRHFIQYIRERISCRFAEQTAEHLQKELLEKIFQIGPNRVSQYGSGNTVTLALEGIASFRTYLQLFVPRFLAMFIIPAMVLVYIYTLDLLSGVVLTLAMPIMITFLILLGIAAKKKMEDQLTTFRMLSRHFVDSLRGIVTLKYLGKSKPHVKAIESVSDKYRKATMKTLVVAFLSSFNLNFFASLSTAVLAVELGVRLINGTTMLEMALAVLILAPDYFSPVREFGNDFHATMDGKQAGARIHRMLEEKTVDSMKEDAVIEPWSKGSSLKIERLGLNAENEERMIISNINFRVDGFKKIGIIGISGAGKSTLINLLAGFLIPSKGRIWINDQSYSHAVLKDWQKQLTYIPQHPYIFSGTVKENISWYHPEATEAELKEAIKVAGLAELIEQLPNGIDEEIGQGARSLSGGEEQRIALARAIIKRSPVMFFDEPTAHLDIETEYDIKQRIVPLMENKLVFFATHRLHWLKQMDIILVMEHGEIVEMGTHEELFQKNGTYVELLERSKQA